MKRTLSLLLAIVMVFSLIPMAAFAADQTTISFETTFNDEMTVGDTFTVTANLANNVNFLTMTLSLKWNEDVVKFTGFNKTSRGALETEVYTYTAAIANHELGIVTGSDAYGYDTNGKIFTANFEIIGSGDLDIGLKDADATEFEMVDGNYAAINPAIDYSAIEGLSVAGGGGLVIPEGAPFSAVTTDAGDALNVEQWDDLPLDPWGSGAGVDTPHYHITIPADAAEAYITFDVPASELMEQTFIYGGEPEVGAAFSSVNHDDLGESAVSGMSGLPIGENGDDYTNVIVPVNFIGMDMNFSQVELPALKSEELYYAVGPQDAMGNTIALFSFEYGAAEAPFEVYVNEENITDITAGEASWTNWDGSELTLPMYTVTVPNDATEATLVFAEEKQWSYYTSTGDYVGAGDTSWTSSTEHTVAIQDSNSDNELDGISVQIPGEFSAEFYILFVAEGGAPTSYSITIDESITGGTVSAADEAGNAITEATEGTLVYLNMQPDAGYRLQSFHVDSTAGAIGADNGCFLMPAGDVTISAVFTPVTYQVNVTAAENGTVAADKTAAAAGETVKLTVTPAEGYVLDTLTVMQGETPVSVADNAFTMPAGAVTVTASFKAEAAGYTFATSADVTAEDGGTATVSVKITGNGNEAVTGYNAYDVTLTFDDTKLEYVSYDGAVKADNGSVTVSGNTIRIVGCGEAKAFSDALATLTFKTLGEGAGEVTVSKVQVSDKEESVKADAPEATAQHGKDDTAADTTPEQSVILVPYTVSKPAFVSGADKVLPGESYTFSYTDTANYTYTELKVLVGGTVVTPTEADGVYTVENVTGAVVITATQTANAYDVTKPENVEGPDQATYGTDYEFTVTPSEGKEIDTVTVTTADGTQVDYTINENGEYVIKGTDISGELIITVTEKEKEETETTVTFSGVAESEVVGGLSQTAEIGKAFTFTLNKEENFDYTVKVGEAVLEANQDGSYTIPAELVVADGVTVTIEKKDNTKAAVEVSEYFNVDGKVMFLVTAKWGDKVLAYGEETMLFSSKYDAYCWLVLSTDEMNTVDLVKAAAETAIVEAAADAVATTVDYDYDVNNTTKVDVNDAQLAYDMYNASYMEFTENLPMLKFLEADMSTDMKLDTKDVAAIINHIVTPAN